MKNFKLFFLIICITFITQSCNIMYVPNMQNVPLLKEKNEVRATIGPFDFQGAYAITDNIGVMVNGQYSKSNSNSFYSNERTCSLIEAGAGYSKTISDNGIFEIYGGFGSGSNSNKIIEYDYWGSSVPLSTSSFSANTSRFFVQPSIGYTNEFIDLAFSNRFVFLQYSKIDTLGYTPSLLMDEKLMNIDKPLFVFWEPALTLRFGYKYVKFHVQALFSYKYNSEPLNYIPFNMNFGMHINIAKRHKTPNKRVRALIE